MKASVLVRFAALILLAAGFAAPSFAEDNPASLAGAKIVAAEEVQKLQAAGALLIDTRVAAEYAEGHIKGSVSIPYREKSAKAANFDASQDEFAIAKLPADKKAAIVIYCNGPSCWKSYKASVAAIKAGYTNINWFRDGVPGWQAKGLPLEQ
jgi:rhodanese-related sulfurtransferase